MDSFQPNPSDDLRWPLNRDFQDHEIEHDPNQAFGFSPRHVHLPSVSAQSSKPSSFGSVGIASSSRPRSRFTFSSQPIRSSKQEAVNDDGEEAIDERTPLSHGSPSSDKGGYYGTDSPSLTGRNASNKKRKSKPSRRERGKPDPNANVEANDKNPDGRVSIEMHLELYAEDLLNIASNDSESPNGDNGKSSPDQQQTDSSPPLAMPTPLQKQKSFVGSTNDSDTTATASNALNDAPKVVEDLNEAIARPQSAGSAGDESQDIELHNVLAGIEYLLHTRIHDKLPHLDGGLCRRLCAGLLYHMKQTEGSWLTRPRITDNAALAFEVFAGLVEDVEEVQDCVDQLRTNELRKCLMIHRHLQPDHSEEHEQIALRLLMFLSQNFAKFSDWRELVNSSAHGKVEAMLHNAQSFHNLERPIRADRLPPKGSYYDNGPHHLVKMFRSDAESGLSAEEVENRKKLYGPNELPEAEGESVFKMLLKQLTDFIVLVLLAAAIVSAAISDFKACGTLLVVVIINAAIGFVQEYKAKKALDALSHLSVPKATVLRDSSTSVIDAKDLVPGDIVLLEEGDNIPADLRVIESSQLSVIEALLTGESVPIQKTSSKIRTRSNLPIGDRINMAFMSTVVAKGRGKGIVVNTGSSTEVGKICSAISATEVQQTPLQIKLARLGKWLVLFSVVACGALVGVGYWRGQKDIIKPAISLAVSVIPEGLVTVVTLTMALGMQRMAKQNAIVRKLPSVETLGSVTTICSDKTGTLTEGKMRAEEMWVPALGEDSVVFRSNLKGSYKPKGKKKSSKRKHDAARDRSPIASSKLSGAMKRDRPEGSVAINIDDYSEEGRIASDSPRSMAEEGSPFDGFAVLRNRTVSFNELPSQMQWLLAVSAVCNNASIVRDEEGHWKTVGDSTEVALQIAAAQAKCPPSYWTETVKLKRVHEFAFDSDRKRMSVLCELPHDVVSSGQFLGVQLPQNATHILFTKGASEAIFERCSTFMTSSNTTPSPTTRSSKREGSFSEEGSSGGAIQLSNLDERMEKTLATQGLRLAKKGMRVLAAAMKFMKSDEAQMLIHSQSGAQKEGAASSSGEDHSLDLTSLKRATSVSESEKDESEKIESELCFLGVAGIMDPPRAEVAPAVERCQQAGIRVCMITGDHIETALAVARAIKIYGPKDKAVRGESLNAMSEQQLANMKPFPVVFARVSPENKLKIVRALQMRGDIVAMTGDGVNDAPAIKQADVGIAMGQSGTEITRQAAGIILADDNFATIVSAIEEGRRIFDNITKFVVYLLSCNTAEVLIMLFAVAVDWPIPFLSMMILWANIFADVPPSLSLGVEPCEHNVMTRKPRDPKHGVLTPVLTAVVLFNSALMAGITAAAYWYALHWDKPVPEAQSLAFTILTVLQLVHSFFCRSIAESVILNIRHIADNRWMVVAFVVSMTFIVLGLYVPEMNSFLTLEPVHAEEWAIASIGVAVYVVVMEVEKYILRKRFLDRI